MKRLSLGQPASQSDTAWAIRSLKMIERASIEDAEQIFNSRTITGSFVETRELNAATATLTDLVNFVATLVSDIQKRGQNRTGV